MDTPEPNEIHCPQCGYDLRAAERGRCPECGFGYDQQAIRSKDDEWFVYSLNELRYAANFGRVLVALTVLRIAYSLLPVYPNRLISRRTDSYLISAVIFVTFLVLRQDKDREWAGDSYHALRSTALGVSIVGVIMLLYFGLDLPRESYWVVFPLSGLPLTYVAMANYRDGLRLGRHASLEPLSHDNLRKWYVRNWYVIGFAFAAGMLASLFL